MCSKKQVKFRAMNYSGFFEVEASIKVNQGSFKGVLSPTQRFKSQEELLSFVSSKQAKIGNQEGIIADVQTKEKKTNSPSLFSLSSLQSKVNQLYKATASQTLKAMQGLYEAKLLSYPRTDTPFITENEFAYLKANFGKYSGFLGLDLEMVQTEPRKRYVDGSKVQEHHAIIPTKQVPTESALAKMDDLQRKIYALVVKTTVAMFLPDYLYEETKIQTKVADLLFQSIGKTPKQEGWKILFKQQTKEEKEDVQTLPLVIIGERAEVGVKSVEKETQPPKAFTEGTLLTAMKTANKTVDDEEEIKILQEVEGIGTEATRASIIEALKQKEYIQVIKNKLVVTEKGKLLCQAVESQHLLTSAEMTAKWETYLKKIGKREGNQENFITNIKKFIVHLLEAVPNDIEKLNFSDYQEQKEKEAEKSIVGKCPKCGNNIVLKNQLLLFHFQEKNSDHFFDLIEQEIANVNPIFQTVFKTFLKDKDKVLNAMELPYSNAKLEATNNLIKVIKRNAFGFRNFENFKKRILIALNIKKERTKFVLSRC
ncbi:DNA topoisomerase [Streptococcus suis]|nr:DNA topoisomerase [Streptococcus suis]